MSGASFSLQRRLQAAFGYRLKPILQAKAHATLCIFLLSATASGADRWVEYRIGPFHVISNSGDKASREELNEMEQMRYSLGTELGKVGMGKDGLVTMWPIEVVLFANQREYLAHSPGKPFIDGGSATLSAWSADTPLPREWLRALARLLIDDNAVRMPDAIESALCDLYSTIQVKNTHVSLGAPLPSGELQKDRLRAWAKMQMLATQPDYSGKLRVYLNNIQQNGDEGVAARNAFDLTAAQLEVKLDAYVKAGKFEAAPVGGEPLDPNRDFPEKPVDKAVVDGLLAELAAGGKNFPPDSPRGLVEKNTHASLELAIKANPKWAEPQFKLAQIETDSLAKMKELKAAATLDPRNAGYWQALAVAQGAADDYDGAAKSWAMAEKSARDEPERARIHIAKMALDAARADFTEAEKRRRAEEAARDLERIKGEAAAEVHAAEAAANARLNAGKAAYQTPTAWWDEPTGAKIEGKLTRVDCLNGPLRLTIQKDGGALAKVAVRDLKKLTVNGANEAKFGCGATKPVRKIRLTYEAKPDAKLGTLGDVLVVEFPLMTRIPLRWVAIGIFLFATMLNYLDRSLMAALAPTLKANFHLDNAQYGWIVTAFSLAYAGTAPLAGVFIDRIGLNLGAMIAVAAFSCTGAATGLAVSFGGLAGIRTAFGVTAAAGLPLFGKANAIYLEPSERAFGTAMNQVGISLGVALAPVIVGILTPLYGWRSSFVVCGALGFVWVPLWWFVAKRIPAKEMAPAEAGAASLKELLRDRRVWGLAFATIFIMSLYTLWTNWTTLYFVEGLKMTMEEANRNFAWIPPGVGTLGGFFGGWLAFRAIRGGTPVITARLRVSWLSAGFALVTAAIPFMPSRGLAAVAVCFSYFWTVCISANLYALPIDLFGPRRAAFGVAVLTFAYGILQSFVSPIIGRVADHEGFQAVFYAMSVLPLVGVWILQITTRNSV